jgi:hypothetical protein
VIGDRHRLARPESRTAEGHVDHGLVRWRVVGHGHGVGSVTVYLTDMDLFQKMNGVYGTYFTTPRPVRAAVGVAKLATPKGRIEISVIAAKK